MPKTFLVTPGTCTQPRDAARHSQGLEVEGHRQEGEFPKAEDLTNSSGISRGLWKCVLVSPGLAAAPGLLSSHFK